MEPTVVTTDTKVPKLTLTPTRFAVKLPLDFPPLEAARVLRFARDLFDKFGAPAQSIRGTIKIQGDQLRVALHKNDRVVVLRFDEVLPRS